MSWASEETARLRGELLAGGDTEEITLPAATVDHGSTAIRSGGDQPASPLARIAFPGKSGSNPTAAAGGFATSRDRWRVDPSDAVERATGEANPKAGPAAVVGGSASSALLDSAPIREK